MEKVSSLAVSFKIPRLVYVAVWLNIFILAILNTAAYSQGNLSGQSVNSVISSADNIRRNMPVEKVYVQTDKPYYTSGDTLWLKAYLFDAAYLKSSLKSGLLYIELANDTGKVMDRRMLSLSYGLGHGNIVLGKDAVPPGSYILRAYTNWMRNFGDDYVFEKRLYISSTEEQSWLVSSAIKQNSGDSIRMAVQFRRLNGLNVGLRDLQLRLMDGNRTLFRNQVRTSVEGKLDVNFRLPEKADAKNITLLAEDLLKDEGNRKISIPVAISRPENMDLQFLPEGGNLVAGSSSRVAFKAISEDGKGIDVTGKIMGRDNSEITEFSSLHKGMGSFEIIPEAGETYFARVNFPGGSVRDYPLPQVKSSGTALRVNYSGIKDSIDVVVSLSADLLDRPAAFYLVGRSRGVICYAARINLTKDETLKKVPKSAFPTGITRFTLLNANRQPLNERIIFVNHHDDLRVTLHPDKEAYGSRDSIALEIEVKDKDGNPVRGSFSLAVTDDSQVQTDTIGNNILSTLLLTSDLKGAVEEPAYYLRSDLRVTEDIDLLMLTQGWTGYDWTEAFTPAVPEFAAESEFTVNGRVTNIFNRSLAGTGIVLFSARPVMTMNTLTDPHGKFSFAGFPRIDTAAFVLMARNKRDKSFNVGIEIDEFSPQVFKPLTNVFNPWYLNSDTTLLNQAITIIQQQKESLPKGARVLQEVVVTAKKIIKDSFNLNGPGEADQVIDQKDLEKAGKKTLFNLLEERIKGFILRPPIFLMGGDVIPARYQIIDRRIRLVIDGMDVIQMDSTVESKEGFRDYTEYYTAEDIKGIEVMYNKKYMSRYNSNNLAPGEQAEVDERLFPVWLEITTYSGKGPWMKKTPGRYFYRTMPFAGSKQFYRPRYLNKDSAVLKDARSTIHWAPDVVTDKYGKARVSFYSADIPGAYTVILEGSDMNGSLGYTRKTIDIKAP